MTLTNTDYILDELRVNNALLRRVIELQEIQTFASLGIAKRRGHISEEMYNDMVEIIEGKKG